MYARDFVPQFYLDNNDIETVDEAKLLGLVVRSDLSWSSNTASMVERCNKKLWFLRRLKKLGATTPYDLNDLYHRHICSTLEYATRVWHFSLTNEDTLKFERIQKSALHIILGEG